MANIHPQDSSAPPTDADLATMLGSAKPALDALVSGSPGRIAEWRRYSSKSAWILRVCQGKQPIIYLKPEPLAIKATVLLGARAVEAALAGQVSTRLRHAIERAKVCPEGRPVEVRVTGVSDVARVEQLVAVKLRPERRTPSSRKRPMKRSR
jgi:hypothetical protein